MSPKLTSLSQKSSNSYKKKLFIALIASLGLGILINWHIGVLIINLIFELREANLFILLLPLIALSIYSCYLLAKVNSGSSKLAFFGVVISISCGFLFVWYILQPIIFFLTGTIIPLNWDLRIAIGSGSGIWLYTSIIFILEVITDNIRESGRLRRLFLSTFYTTIFLIVIEVFLVYALKFIESGSSEEFIISLIKTFIYGLIIWGVIVTAVNKK